MLITDYIRFNGFSRPGRKLTSVRGIVLHYTGDPGASDVSIRGYFDRLAAQDPNDKVPDRYASAHLVVDLDGSIIEMIPTNEMAYHCGAEKYIPGIESKLGILPNMTTLGIELCHPDETGRFLPDTLNSAILVTAWLCFRFNLNPRTQLFRHYDVTGKLCPKYWVEQPAEFDAFQKRVELSMNLGGVSV